MPKQLVFRFDTPETQSFDAFVAGENTLAVAMLRQLIRGASERQVLLWGSSGVGKTHLLMATGAEAAELGLRVSYIPCLEFVAAFPMMLEGLEQRDLVLLDDVDALAGNREAEEALFHCLNKLRDANVALVVTAATPPQQLPIQLADVRSRLGQGLVFRLSPLLDQDLLGALRQWAQLYHIHLPEEVERYLLQHCSRQPAVLRELIQVLAEATLQEQHRLTLQFVKNCIRDRTTVSQMAE
ncbi:MAG TPA: DnaA regulatory inactivator Hda [Pseudomonadales bacterium]|nr:DnaA regulatory inactivator Hda [Pseudomonadales bacterium]